MKNNTIGIIGGGQLGLMFIQNAINYGIKTIVLANDIDDPAIKIADSFLIGSLQDEAKIIELASKCDVLTYEIEHINVDILLKLESEGKKIIPSPKILQILQNKGLQKQFYQQNNIPTSPFAIVQNTTEWLDTFIILNTQKIAAKSCKDGYDGKGVFLTTKNYIENNLENLPFLGETMIEKLVDCKYELAVLIARNEKGETAIYNPVEMQFDKDANLVTYLISPANVSKAIEESCKKIALQCIEAFDGIGLFAVEFFVDENDIVLVNEIAPRPHNSAHHTIEGFYSSQFDQLLRILIDLPLGSANQIMPAIMLNIIGNNEKIGEYIVENFDEIKEIEGVYIHLYNKKISKPKRKLGHITIINKDMEICKANAQKIQQLLKIKIL